MAKPKLLITLLLAAFVSLGAQAQHQFDIKANKMGAKIQPTMYGIFFEDINFGADGGLYAEMIENRSFEFPQSLMGWQTFGNVAINTASQPPLRHFESRGPSPQAYGTGKPRLLRHGFQERHEV